MGKKNKAKKLRSLDESDFNEPSSYDYDDYDDYSSKKKKKHRDRRDDYSDDYDNSYDNSEDASDYEDYDDDQEQDYDEEEELDEESENVDSSNESEESNVGVVSPSSGASRLIMPGGSSSNTPSGLSPRTVSLGSSTTANLGGGVVFREVRPSLSPARPQNAASTNSGYSLGTPRVPTASPSFKPVRPEPQVEIGSSNGRYEIARLGRDRVDPKVEERSERGHRDTERVDKERSSNGAKNPENDAEEKRLFDERAKEIKVLVREIAEKEKALKECAELLESEPDDQALNDEKVEHETALLDLRIQKVELELEQLNFQRESSDSDELEDEERELCRELKELKKQRKRMKARSFSFGAFAGAPWNAFKSGVVSLVSRFRSNDEADAEDVYSDGDTEGEEDRNEMAKKSKKSKRNGRLDYEEISEEAVSDATEEGENEEDDLESDLRRDWGRIGKMAGAYTVAASLLLALGYTGFLFYSGSKHKEQKPNQFVAKSEKKVDDKILETKETVKKLTEASGEGADKEDAKNKEKVGWLGSTKRWFASKFSRDKGKKETAKKTDKKNKKEESNSARRDLAKNKPKLPIGGEGGSGDSPLKNFKVPKTEDVVKDIEARVDDLAGIVDEAQTVVEDVAQNTKSSIDDVVDNALEVLETPKTTEVESFESSPQIVEDSDSTEIDGASVAVGEDSATNGTAFPDESANVSMEDVPVVSDLPDNSIEETNVSSYRDARSVDEDELFGSAPSRVDPNLEDADLADVQPTLPTESGDSGVVARASDSNLGADFVDDESGPIESDSNTTASILPLNGNLDEGADWGRPSSDNVNLLGDSQPNGSSLFDDQRNNADIETSVTPSLNSSALDLTDNASTLDENSSLVSDALLEEADDNSLSLGSQEPGSSLGNLASSEDSLNLELSPEIDTDSENIVPASSLLSEGSDANETAASLSRNLNDLSREISHSLNDFSERSSEFSERLNDSAQNLETKIQNGLDSVNQRLADGTETVQNWAQQASESVTSTIEGVSNAANDTWNAATGGARSLYDETSATLSSAYDSAANSVRQVGENLNNSVQNARNALSNSFDNNNLGALSGGSDSLISNDLNSVGAQSLTSNPAGNSGLLGSSSNLSKAPNEPDVSLAPGNGFSNSEVAASPSLNSSPNVLSESNSFSNLNNSSANLGGATSPNGSLAGVPSSLSTNSGYSGTSVEPNSTNGFIPRDSVLNSGTSQGAMVTPSYANAENLGQSSGYSTRSNGDYNAVTSTPANSGVAIGRDSSNAYYNPGGGFANTGTSTSGSFGTNASQNLAGGANVGSVSNSSTGYPAFNATSNAYPTANNPSAYSGNTGSNYYNGNYATNGYASSSSNYSPTGTQSGNNYASANRAVAKTPYREYITKEGDNLLTIAENELGSSSRFGEIKKLNNLKSGATYFEVGTRIKLPTTPND